MKKEIFEGKAGDKLVVIEGILKSNNDGAGFFVGDGVRSFELGRSFYKAESVPTIGNSNSIQLYRNSNFKPFSNFVEFTDVMKLI